MRIIEQNPYRQLGVFANSPTRERVANHNRLKAFLNVGREVSFSLDLSQFLPAIGRTAESVAEAEAQLTLPKDQLRYAQFWFLKSTPIDDIAFNHLFTGNMDEAIGLWSKKDNASSLQNRVACHLIKGEYQNALICAQKLYSSYADQLVSIVLGDSTIVATNELAHYVLDAICEEVGANNLLSYLNAVPDAEWKEYIGKATINPIIHKIEEAISTAKERKGKRPAACIAAGRKLMSSTKPLLTQLRKLLPKTDLQYQIIADKLGVEILQCGIDYYNGSDEPDCALKAMKLQEYALQTVVGKMAKDRCQENVDILKKIIDELPPAEVLAENAAIQDELATFAIKPDLIKYSIQLIKGCAPHIVAIKEKLGKDHPYYLRISTTIVNAALGNVISEVNAAQTKRNFDTLKSTLISAWRTQLYLDKFDVEPAYKNGRLKECRSALHNIIEQCKGFEPSIHSSNYIYGCGWCNDLDVSDVDLRTDDEFYASCQSLASYEDYLSKFPTGKHVSEARSKVMEIGSKERRKKKIKWTCWIGIPLMVLLAIFLIWGFEGLGGICIAITVFAGIGALGCMKEGEGCGSSLIFIGVAAVFGIIGYEFFNLDKIYQERKAEEELYEQIVYDPTENSCSTYIERYASHKRADVVRDTWLTLIMNESDSFDYYSQVASSTSSIYSSQRNPVEKLQDYLEKNENTDFEAKAKLFLDELCDSLYTVAKNKYTVAGWKQYQRTVPLSYYRDSEKNIEEIENRAWNTEAKAWKQATAENSLSAYTKYKSLYPKGAHINQCEKRIIDLEVSNIYSGEHGSLPAMDKIGYGGGSTSYITVKNNTSYTLTIMYSGSESKKLVIRAGETQSIRLKNGQYRVAASVAAYNVRNYAGTENLSGGNYSASYYISTHYGY